MFKPEDLKIERGEDKLVEYKFGTKKNSYKVNVLVQYMTYLADIVLTCSSVPPVGST
jgi:hypothetical protein